MACLSKVEDAKPTGELEGMTPGTRTMDESLRLEFHRKVKRRTKIREGCRLIAKRA